MKKLILLVIGVFLLGACAPEETRVEAEPIFSKLSYKSSLYDFEIHNLGIASADGIHGGVILPNDVLRSLNEDYEKIEFIMTVNELAVFAAEVEIDRLDMEMVPRDHFDYDLIAFTTNSLSPIKPDDPALLVVRITMKDKTVVTESIHFTLGEMRR